MTKKNKKVAICEDISHTGQVKISIIQMLICPSWMVWKRPCHIDRTRETLVQRALSYRPCAGNMCANAVHGIGDPTWQTRSISCKIAYQESICYSRSSIGNLILRSAPSVQAWHALGSIKQTRELGGMVISRVPTVFFLAFQISKLSIFPFFFQFFHFFFKFLNLLYDRTRVVFFSF